MNLLSRRKVIKTRFIVITWAEIYTSNEGWTEKEFALFALVVELVCPCQIVISKLIESASQWRLGLGSFYETLCCMKTQNQCMIRVIRGK